ncbi:sensor histidine kinase [Saccharothrix longispora]|uniref:histidine kinase n=1 Tax=Saccharothrix longispora TaxID=33920 RepID=A0ABU1PRF0_9PSEU|nr:sensor histidine kinase [Saccharothrix longispora]MDR6593221.1 signal transduction histidine kinase [Saccharothrix longispora]
MRFSLTPIRLDVLLALVLTWLTLDTVVSRADGQAQFWEYVLAALTAAPIALRQRAPVATVVVMLAAFAAFNRLGSDLIPNSGIGLLVGVFTVATLRSRVVTAAVVAATLCIVVAAVLGIDDIAWSEAAQTVMVVLGVWVLGEGTRRWAERAERAAESAARAVAEERVRIARELHDVVAHHMSVISLQAGLASYVLDTDLATARKAIDTVGRTSREALTEMRRLLDVLRVDQDGDYRPQPGLSDLDELVDRARDAGLTVEVRVTGDTRPLPPGPDLCAYRVAQESLTNVLKHAAAARALVELDYGQQTLTLKVTDDGATAAPHRVPVTSHGIRGMRERAELYGGVLTAGPRAGGGFGVVLRLPLEDSQSEDSQLEDARPEQAQPEQAQPEEFRPGGDR